MNLGDWADSNIGELGDNRTAVLRSLAAALLAAGNPISFNTLRNTASGMKLKKYEHARAIEKATSGAVTVKELCE